MVDVEFSFLHDKAKRPYQKHDTDAGYDLHSVEERVIPARGFQMVGTGIAMSIPRGFFGMICSRSGLAAKNGIFVLNSPGIIDCFTEDTRIKTIVGEKTINELSLGELVISLNENLKEEKKRVVAIADVGEKEVYEIETENGKTLRVSEGTLVLTQRGYVRVDSLKENDELLVL